MALVDGHVTLDGWSVRRHFQLVYMHTGLIKRIQLTTDSRCCLVMFPSIRGFVRPSSFICLTEFYLLFDNFVHTLFLEQYCTRIPVWSLLPTRRFDSRHGICMRSVSSRGTRALLNNKDNTHRYLSTDRDVTFSPGTVRTVSFERNRFYYSWYKITIEIARSLWQRRRRYTIGHVLVGFAVFCVITILRIPFPFDNVVTR